MSTTKRAKRARGLDLAGKTPESWLCVDCNVNTAPGLLNRIEMERAFKSLPLSGKESVPMEVSPWSEIYTVRESVWKQSGMKPMSGCLCIGCLEKRLGRQLTPEDFDRKDAFKQMPGTVRLMSRRMGCGLLNHADGLFAVCGGNATPVKSVGEGEEIIRKWAEAHAN